MNGPAQAAGGKVGWNCRRPLLQISGLGVRFGDQWALRGVNLDVWRGESLAFIGPNGAGKSTLMKSLVGAISLLDGHKFEGGNLKVGYFSQHQVDDLDLSKTLNINNKLFKFNPSNNDLIIFNSYLNHSVLDKNQEDEDRISLAFSPLTEPPYNDLIQEMITRTSREEIQEVTLLEILKYIGKTRDINNLIIVDLTCLRLLVWPVDYLQIYPRGFLDVIWL